MNAQINKKGRRIGQNKTKDQILTAALTLFTKTGYDKTTIRDIAKSANVDPALVMHYFGTKEELFITAMTPSQNVPQKMLHELSGDRETLGLRLATLFIEMVESKATNQFVISVFRAVVQIPAAASLFKMLIIQPVLRIFKNTKGLDHAELRMSLIHSQLIGVFMSRYILKVQPLASLSSEEVIAYIAPTLQKYLTDDLNERRKEVNGNKRKI